MDKWHEVKSKAGLTEVDDGNFLPSQQFDQELTHLIVGGIIEVTVGADGRASAGGC